MQLAPQQPGTGFHARFSVVPALSAELQKICFGLRHRVYCEELGYEPVRADGLETDEFDRDALHCLLRGRYDGDWVGTARLIRPSEDGPLPIERTCGDALHSARFDIDKIPREAIAEVSRLTVTAHYRRRKGEDRKSLVLDDDADLQIPTGSRFPYIPVGLYLGMLAMAVRHKISYVLVLTEPRLANHLTRLGFAARQVGEAVQCSGLRIPSLMITEEVIDKLGSLLRPVFEQVSADLDAAFRDSRMPA